MSPKGRNVIIVILRRSLNYQMGATVIREVEPQGSSLTAGAHCKRSYLSNNESQGTERPLQPFYCMRSLLRFVNVFNLYWNAVDVASML
ncbi:MAG: hypothetical protein ACTS4V_01945 [Candidatus Hodgkinia cicadicola]